MKGRWPFHWMYGAFLREAGLALNMPEDDAPGIKRGFNDQGLAIANSNWHAPEPVTESITSAQMPPIWGLTRRDTEILIQGLAVLRRTHPYSASPEEAAALLVKLWDTQAKL